MSVENVNIELEEVEESIQKLESFLASSKRKDYLIGDYLGGSLEFIPEVLPATLLPALFGACLYGDVLEIESMPGKVAMCALVTPIALPAFALSAILTIPIAAPVVAISSIMGGVQTTYAGAHNTRITKAEKKLEKLKKRKEELTTKISTIKK